MFKLFHRGRNAQSRGQRAKFFGYAGIALGFAMAAGGLPIEANATSPYLVQTKQGPVQGFLGNSGVVEFLGIPYAVPPVGNLRWMPPKAHASWTKVLKATAAGPICLQATTLGPFAGPANANEDCLYLNVYTPDLNPGKEPLPVIVWIHGGANLDGGSTDYDGTKLAAQGRVIVVTINYRLGLLGFMANPAIDAEGHPFANYGLMDQQLALKWVQRNIAAFGGDKNNVTVGGQSAGSVDAESHVISPLSAGLFQHAIFQSVLLEPSPLSTAEAKGVAFSVAAGCGSGATPSVAKCLRRLSAQQIFDLSGTASTAAPYESNIIQDGQVLPSATFTSLIAAGKFNHVPIMGGTTEDEQNFSLGITEYFENPRVPFSATDYDNKINSFGAANYPPGTQAKVKALYPLGAYASPQLALDAIGTDSTACAQRYSHILYSSQVPLYYYEFDDETAPSYFPVMPGFQPLAYHTADIPYLFPGWHGGPQGIPHSLNAGQEKLSDELVAAWTNFAWTGNPNGQGNAPWPLYTPNKPNVPSIFAETRPNLTTMSDAQFNAKHHCNFWASISTY
ncbi:MAG TPA: carboxylesterase family protein [Methylovirgula sp.]|nr:carboxylesterase family protein [Methylovirgula sp.]